MQSYLNQLMADISYAIQNISLPYVDRELSLQDWISEEEEERTAPLRNLQEWTGISQEMLPPADMLNDEQLQQLTSAIIKMLDAYNCHFVMQMQVPLRVQYETIRNNFDQDVRIMRWHMGFFELCRPGIKHKACTLGEYCHCCFYAEMFKDMIHEDLSPEEERARMLEIEVRHIKRKYGEDWFKYYPFHLDKNYDDENGNPYDYGFGEEDEDGDDWWRK